MLQERLGQERYFDWVRHVAQVSLDEKALTVAFTSRRARSESQSRMFDTVTSCARAVTRRSLHVRFVVVPPPQTPPPLPASSGSPLPAPLRAHHVPAAPARQEFVLGAANEAACRALHAFLGGARSEAHPLVLHGPPGCGKTRLLARAVEIARGNPRIASIQFATADEFTGQYTFAVHRGLLAAFQQKYRTPDLLLFDDVHGLAGRPATQVEFLHTVDALERAGKRLVVTSLWPGRELTEFDTRLRVRLKSGLETRVLPADGEMRRAAAAQWNRTAGRVLAADLVDLVADRVAGPLGRLRQVLEAVATLRAPGRAQVEDLIARLGCAPAPTIEELGRAVALAFGLREEELRGANRSRRVSRPRQVCFWLAGRLTGYAPAEIGAWFGGRDRPAVLAAQAQVERWLQADAALRARVDDVEREIRRGSFPPPIKG
jgi:chromosomal replication initiator protein